MMTLLVELSTGFYNGISIIVYRLNLNLVCLEAVLKIRREMLTVHHCQKKNTHIALKFWTVPRIGGVNWSVLTSTVFFVLMTPYTLQHDWNLYERELQFHDNSLLSITSDSGSSIFSTNEIGTKLKGLLCICWHSSRLVPEFVTAVWPEDLIIDVFHFNCCCSPTNMQSCNVNL
jgi:hypothetical protein